MGIVLNKLFSMDLFYVLYEGFVDMKDRCAELNVAQDQWSDQCISARLIHFELYKRNMASDTKNGSGGRTSLAMLRTSSPTIRLRQINRRPLCQLSYTRARQS